MSFTRHVQQSLYSVTITYKIENTQGEKNMVKRFDSVKLILVFGMILLGLLSSSVFISYPTVKAEETRSLALYTFNSYIYIEYDATPLNEPLSIDESKSVQVTVKYKTDVPENFLQFLPWQIKNILIFGSVIGPMQTIHLEIIDEPEWADIYLTTPDVIMDIPVGSEINEQKITLVLSPKIEAPATPETISIRATSKEIGRINSATMDVAVPFTPSFVPTITIIPENPTRTVSPRESVNFKISVTNEANKKARITPSPSTNGSINDWSPTINPPFMDLNPGASGDFTYSIYTPHSFGWHNDMQAFQIDFTAQIFPLQADAPEGGPYPIYLRVNNYGFSLPGFEGITILAAIFVVVMIIGYKNKKMKN
jgi:hypothetical protein